MMTHLVGCDVCVNYGPLHKNYCMQLEVPFVLDHHWQNNDWIREELGFEAFFDGNLQGEQILLA